MRKLPLALTTSALALGLALTGCTMDSGNPSSSPSASEPSTVAANTADETFVTMMIPHHQQAIEMADIVLNKDDVDPRVTAVAQQVKDAQEPEIERMLNWLKDWGVDYDPSGNGMGDMDHESMGESDGMMTPDDLATLEAANGTETSRIFLKQMIVHHEGAVEMARTALENGQHPDVLELAQQVIDDQTAEISAMENLLAEL